MRSMRPVFFCMLSISTHAYYPVGTGDRASGACGGIGLPMRPHAERCQNQAGVRDGYVYVPSPADGEAKPSRAVMRPAMILGCDGMDAIA